MKKYKTPRSIRLQLKIFSWIFLISTFLGIWIKEYRWKLIFTGLFCIFLAIILAYVEITKKDKLK